MVLIGEIYLPVERLVAYYGVHLDGAQLPFNFQLLTSAWNSRGIAGLIDQYERSVPAGGWPNWDLVAYIRRDPRFGADVRHPAGGQVAGEWVADEAFLVALNLGPQPYELSLSSLGLKGRVMLSTHLDRTDNTDSQSVALRANEGVIVQLAPIAA
jgi:hypothetical protein